MKEAITKSFPIVVTQLPYNPGENMPNKINKLLSAIKTSIPVEIANVLRMKPRAENNYPPIVKIQLGSTDLKVALLKMKYQLKQNPEFRKVFMHTSKSHELLLQEQNIRTLISFLPPNVRVIKPQ